MFFPNLKCIVFNTDINKLTCVLTDCVMVIVFYVKKCLMPSLSFNMFLYSIAKCLP